MGTKVQSEEKTHIFLERIFRSVQGYVALQLHIGAKNKVEKEKYIKLPESTKAVLGIDVQNMYSTFLKSRPKLIASRKSFR